MKNRKLLIIITIIFFIILCLCSYFKFFLHSSKAVGILNNTTVPENKMLPKKVGDISLDQKTYSDYYIQKVTMYMNSDNKQGQIVFLGDSLTDIGQWNELLNNPCILNRGISGDNTSGVLNRLSEVIKLNPRKIFIMIGINDIGKGLSTNEITKNYSKILGRIKKDLPNTGIYAESVLPINKDLFKTNTSEKQITDLNISLNKLCKSLNVQYIDLYHLFTLPNQNKLSYKYTVSGLHVNGDGYRVWRDALKPYLQ
ncbi:GDSL-type esterase/lipase family protein [Clostridium coskatii]|uniref:Multifunctional acyl-CoA thioesterase I and protease I and lysophospholipase L1 n=1 Tax=Clostridium coskatii TaxID=1705578 RepID=A0A166RIZ6_9CLOT|nr:GDSL-type esterase/lipase family protein [Clostridium coskatii]OAA90841.1 multifunctional acyl-CoA thioesterase I and protease I and lysophospholipase L1 [Clostridium coskatii]OBR96875.1 multifunctional acyl-CoA thioesterase I and protease I and lysophospholipase L1 [Clostridium coskatii]